MYEEIKINLVNLVKLLLGAIKSLMVVTDYQLEKKDWYQMQKQKFLDESEPSSPLFTNFLTTVGEPE